MRPVTFIHRGGDSMASFRLRAQVGAKAVSGNINEGFAEVIVFSKPCAEDLEIAKNHKAAGGFVVVDYCDDHFNHPSLGVVYSSLLEMADRVVCNTAVMAERVGRECTVIPDPYECLQVQPHANGEKLIWFGHSSNLQDVAKFANVPNLTIVSGPQSINGVVPWAKESIGKYLGEANICLLPTRKGAEYKSNNRFITAVMSGLYPVCNQHPAYDEFKGLAWLGCIVTGVKWAYNEGEQLNSLVAEMQRMIKAKYSKEAVGAQWKDLLESI